MSQFVLICLPDFLKSSSKETFCTRDILTRLTISLNILKTLRPLWHVYHKKHLPVPLAFTKEVYYFLLFFVSGFAELLYQIIWMRLAFPSFGIILPILSLAISVFMLGLSMGFLVGRQSLALSKIENKTICTSILYTGRSRYWCIQSAKCVLFEIKS
jgi:hypothetical protein